MNGDNKKLSCRAKPEDEAVPVRDSRVSNDVLQFNMPEFSRL